MLLAQVIVRKHLGEPNKSLEAFPHPRMFKCSSSSELVDIINNRNSLE